MEVRFCKESWGNSWLNRLIFSRGTSMSFAYRWRGKGQTAWDDGKFDIASNVEGQGAEPNRAPHAPTYPTRRSEVHSTLLHVYLRKVSETSLLGSQQFPAQSPSPACPVEGAVPRKWGPTWHSAQPHNLLARYVISGVGEPVYQLNLPRSLLERVGGRGRRAKRTPELTRTKVGLRGKWEADRLAAIAENNSSYSWSAD